MKYLLGEIPKLGLILLRSSVTYRGRCYAVWYIVLALDILIFNLWTSGKVHLCDGTVFNINAHGMGKIFGDRVGDMAHKFGTNHTRMVAVNIQRLKETTSVRKLTIKQERSLHSYKP